MFLIKLCKPDQNCNLMMDVQGHSLGADPFKGVLKNVPKFTGKHLCQSLFFNKVAGLRHTSGGCFRLGLKYASECPAGIYMFRVNNDVFIINFKPISHIGQVLSLLTLKQVNAGWIADGFVTCSKVKLTIKCQCWPHIETSQLICTANIMN